MLAHGLTFVPQLQHRLADRTIPANSWGLMHVDQLIEVKVFICALCRTGSKCSTHVCVCIAGIGCKGRQRHPCAHGQALTHAAGFCESCFCDIQCHDSAVSDGVTLSPPSVCSCRHPNKFRCCNAGHSSAVRPLNEPHLEALRLISPGHCSSKL